MVCVNAVLVNVKPQTQGTSETKIKDVSEGFVLTGARGAIEIKGGIKKVGSGFGEFVGFERILALD